MHSSISINEGGRPTAPEDSFRCAGALRGTAVLVNWLDPRPESDAEFNRWHTQEHLPERMSIPGFLRVRRFIAAGGETTRGRYFTMYEGRSLEVFRSTGYLERLNAPSRWTRAMGAKILANRRSVCQVVATVGDASAGVVMIGEAMGTAPQPGLLGSLHEDGLAVSAHLFTAEPAVTSARSTTTEGELAGRIDQPPQPDHLAVVELAHDSEEPVAARLRAAGLTSMKTYTLSMEMVVSGAHPPRSAQRPDVGP